jgi:hypothetical protein
LLKGQVANGTTANGSAPAQRPMEVDESTAAMAEEPEIKVPADVAEKMDACAKECVELYIHANCICAVFKIRKSHFFLIHFHQQTNFW